MDVLVRGSSNRNHINKSALFEVSVLLQMIQNGDSLSGKFGTKHFTNVLAWFFPARHLVVHALPPHLGQHLWKKRTNYGHPMREQVSYCSDFFCSRLVSCFQMFKSPIQVEIFQETHEKIGFFGDFITQTTWTKKITAATKGSKGHEDQVQGSRHAPRRSAEVFCAGCL